jgi:hypothetical protein
MSVLRCSGQFTDSRIRLYLLISIGLLILAVSVYGVSRGFHHPALGFDALAALLILFIASLRHWARWFLGKIGDSKVSETLKTLPEDYVVLNDVMLPDSKSHVDHVLVGSNGVFAIEIKNYSKQVKCEKDQWFVNGHSIRSLSKEAKRNALAVRSSMSSLFGRSQTSIPYVVPLLVFVRSRAKLELFEPTLSVLRLCELLDFLRDYEGKRPITADDKRAIVHHLQSLQPTAKELVEHGAMTNDDCHGVS